MQICVSPTSVLYGFAKLPGLNVKSASNLGSIANTVVRVAGVRIVYGSLISKLGNNSYGRIVKRTYKYALTFVVCPELAFVLAGFDFISSVPRHYAEWSWYFKFHGGVANVLKLMASDIMSFVRKLLYLGLDDNDSDDLCETDSERSLLCSNLSSDDDLPTEVEVQDDSPDQAYYIGMFGEGKKSTSSDVTTRHVSVGTGRCQEYSEPNGLLPLTTKTQVLSRQDGPDPPSVFVVSAVQSEFPKAAYCPPLWESVSSFKMHTLVPNYGLPDAFLQLPADVQRQVLILLFPRLHQIKKRNLLYHKIDQITIRLQGCKIPDASVESTISDVCDDAMFFDALEEFEDENDTSSISGTGIGSQNERSDVDARSIEKRPNVSPGPTTCD